MAKIADRRKIIAEYGLPEKLADYLLTIVPTGDMGERAAKRVVISLSCGKKATLEEAYLEDRAHDCLDKIWPKNGEREDD